MGVKDKVFKKVLKGQCSTIFLLIITATVALIAFQNCGSSTNNSTPNIATSAAPASGALNLSGLTATESLVSGNADVSATVAVNDSATSNFVAVWTIFDQNDQPVTTAVVASNSCTTLNCSAAITLPNSTQQYGVTVQVSDDQGNSSSLSTSITLPTTPFPHPCPAWGCVPPTPPIGHI